MGEIEVRGEEGEKIFLGTGHGSTFFRMKMPNVGTGG